MKIHFIVKIELSAVKVCIHSGGTPCMYIPELIVITVYKNQYFLFA